MRVEHANETDIQSVVEMNNRFAPAGLTLARSEAFAYAHLADYRVIRSADGAVLGCVALDEYSPSVVELISLAVDPGVQGCGYGKKLIAEYQLDKECDTQHYAIGIKELWEIPAANFKPGLVVHGAGWPLATLGSDSQRGSLTARRWSRSGRWRRSPCRWETRCRSSSIRARAISRAI